MSRVITSRNYQRLLGTVGTLNIIDGTIAAADIASNAVTSAKINAKAVTTAKIDDLAVTAGQIAADAVTTAKILDSNVTNAKIADGVIQSGKLSKFVSTEQTGDGSEQSIAHSLGRTPDTVLIIPTKVHATDDTFVTGTADGTNVKATVSTGSKYIVVAF